MRRYDASFFFRKSESCYGCSVPSTRGMLVSESGKKILAGGTERSPALCGMVNSELSDKTKPQVCNKTSLGVVALSSAFMKH